MNTESLKIIVKDGIFQGREAGSVVSTGVVIAVILGMVGALLLIMYMYKQKEALVYTSAAFVFVAFSISMFLMLYDPSSYLLNAENGKAIEMNGINDAAELKKKVESVEQESKDKVLIDEVVEKLELKNDNTEIKEVVDKIEEE